MAIMKISDFAKLEELKKLIASLDDDAYKVYYRLNFSAGKRLRLGMQQVKRLADEVRKEIQEMKKAGK